MSQASQKRPTTPAERMAELRERARSNSTRRADDPATQHKREVARFKKEEEVAQFIEDEVARFAFGAPGLPSHAIKERIEHVGQNWPSFRLVPRPIDVWEMVSDYSDVFGDCSGSHPSMFGDYEDAFNCGSLFGEELALHDAALAAEQAKGDRTQDRPQDGDTTTRPTHETQWNAVMKAED
jgi:hypothetical protein